MRSLTGLQITIHKQYMIIICDMYMVNQYISQNCILIQHTPHFKFQNHIPYLELG
jgi:hypothetical protein